MLTNNQVKFIRSLQLKKFRDIHHQFVAEGTKLVLDLLQEQHPVRAVYALQEWISEHPVNPGTELVEAAEKELQRITSLTTAPPVIAVFDISSVIPDPASAENELVLLLDDIRDPGNLGTIIRIADWFGIRQIVCSESTVDLYNPKVVQSTMGSIARVKVHYTDVCVYLEKLSKPVKVYGTTLDGENLYNLHLSASGIIVIGSESTGISGQVKKYLTKKLFIPSFGASNHAESLNASVATAVVCAEFRRQTMLQ